MILDCLRNRWKREQFVPTWLGLVVNPFYFARRGLVRELQSHLSRMTGRVLDVGCGTKPYRFLVPTSTYVGLDIDSEVTRKLGAADLYYDGRRFPVPDSSFDFVLCSQVLEHVFAPREFLGEIHRALSPGGTLILTVPFAWDEHEQPRDFARYSSFGLRSILVEVGFEVVEMRKSVANFGAVAQLASAWCFKVFRFRNKWLNQLVQLGIIMPVNVVGAAIAIVSPRNEDFYLDNIVLARKAGVSATARVV